MYGRARPVSISTTPLPLIESKDTAAFSKAYLSPATSSLPLIDNGPNPLPVEASGMPAHLARLRTDGVVSDTSPDTFNSGEPTPLPEKSRLIGLDTILSAILDGAPPSNAPGRSTV